MSEFLKAYCAKAAEQSYEEVVAELVRAEERGARAFMLDLWRAYQAREAAREAEKAPVGEMPAVWSARFRHEQATRCAGCGERKHPPRGRTPWVGTSA